MSRSLPRNCIPIPPTRSQLTAGAIVASLFFPSVSPAFFQETKLDGAIGSDIGGVWLSVQQEMPEFRITYQKPAEGPPVPVKVAPIPGSLHPATGRNPAGVAITNCEDSGFCGDNGLVTGDIIIKVNSTAITDAASFEAAQKDPPPTMVLSVRRPALAMTTARLLKIKYDNEGRETVEGSEQAEKVDLKVLDVVLPFDAALQATRESHKFFEPSAADLAALGKDWARLEPQRPASFIKGTHRIAAKASFDESLQGDESLKNAKVAIVMDMEGNGLSGPGGKVVDVYGVESIGDGKMEGSYVNASLASAPFPINIEFKGRFVMTRVAAWSNADDVEHQKQKQTRPKEDLSKYKTLPDVPPPSKPVGGAKSK
jgi:hypothetical protein